MKHFLITLLYLGTNVFVAYASQDTIPYVISEELIAEGITAHDSGDYHQALELYDLVQPGDSNYVRSISQKAFAHVQLKNYDKAIELYNFGLSMPSEHKASMMSALGSAYDNSGDKDKAIEIFDEGIARYPYYYQLHFNRAVTLMSMREYEAAVAGLQQTIKLRPYHVRSHYYLSKMMMDQDLWAKAMMSMGVYLAINPSYNRALIEINDLVNDARREEKISKRFTKNAAFDKLDLVLKSRVAVQDGYESDLVFKPNIASQFHLFFDKLVYKKDTDDFWMEFYVPFYLKLKEEKVTEAFIYSILSSAGNEKAEKWLKDNSKSKDQYIDIANQLIQENRNTGIVNLDGQPKEYTFWYYDNGAHNAIGNQINDDHFIGPWEFYYGNNEMRSKGSYNDDGFKIGKWHYYDPQGILSNVEEYDKGVLSDIKYYYSSGQMRSYIPYKEDKRNGLVKVYYECGLLKEEAPYKENEIHGSGKVYNIYGGIETAYNYKNGKLDGDYKKFHRDGSPASIYHYKDGSASGKAIGYFDNGQVEFEANYVNDKFDGAYKSYYKNGQLKEEGIYKDGSIVGEWKSYHANGNVESIIAHDQEGELDGGYLGFSKSGSKYYDLQYVQGLLVKATYYTPDGEVVGEGGDPEGNFLFKRYYPNGQLAFECRLKNGMYNGEGISYFKNGAKQLVSEYKDDVETGAYKDYYKNGNLASQGLLKEGAIDQYVVLYDIHGNKTGEGWTVDGESDQTWRHYYPSGVLSEEINFRQGVRHGWTYDYDPEGRIYTAYHYRDGETVEALQYDTLGMVYNRIDISANKESQPVVYEYKNGKPRSNVELGCATSQLSATKYYLSGNPALEEAKAYGQSQGLYRFYNPLSVVLTEGSSAKDQLTGDWKYYNNLGHLTLSSHFAFDKRHGAYKNFYYDGSVEVALNYEHGIRKGIGVFTDPEGNIQIRKHYDENGDVHGFSYELEDGAFTEMIPLQLTGDYEVKAFFKNGKPSVSIGYKDGLLHGPTIYYNNKGVIIEEIQYKFGDYNGSSKRFYNDGSTLEEKEYIDDLRTGITRLYHPNGQKAEESNWLSGVRHGWMTLYDASGKELYKAYYVNDSEY